MKIICDNKVEYDSVIESCIHIHDMTVCIRGASKKTKIEVINVYGNERKNIKPDTEMIKIEKGSRSVCFGLDLTKYSFLNFLAHGIYDCDEQIRNIFLEIKEK